MKDISQFTNSNKIYSESTDIYQELVLSTAKKVSGYDEYELSPVNCAQKIKEKLKKF